MNKKRGDGRWRGYVGSAQGDYEEGLWRRYEQDTLLTSTSLSKNKICLNFKCNIYGFYKHSVTVKKDSVLRK